MPIDGHHEKFWIRVDAILVLLLENEHYILRNRYKELLITVQSKFDVAEDTAKKYITFAKKEYKKLCDENLEEARQKAIKDREWLIKSSKADPESRKRDILEFMKDRDKLRGLYVDESKQTVDLNLKKLNLDSLTTPQLEKLKELLSNNVPLKDALLHIGVIIE